MKLEIALLLSVFSTAAYASPMESLTITRDAQKGFIAASSEQTEAHPLMAMTIESLAALQNLQLNRVWKCDSIARMNQGRWEIASIIKCEPAN